MYSCLYALQFLSKAFILSFCMYECFIFILNCSRIEHQSSLAYNWYGALPGKNVQVGLVFILQEIQKNN